MLKDISFIEALKLFIPVIVLQFSLMFFCIYNIFKYGVRNFSKGIWTLIVIFINLLGPISFLMFGKKKGYDD